jgi:hypothetical protein
MNSLDRVNCFIGRVVGSLGSLRSRIQRDEAGLSTFVEVIILIGVIVMIGIVITTVVYPAIRGGFDKAANNINSLP